MQYRKLGKSGLDVSLLGFGCMRFPLKDKDDPASVDLAEASLMVRHAIDRGVNYLDTAYPYHGGEGEQVLGEILKDCYRERVLLATKLPCWKVETEGDFEKYLDEQLTNLNTDYIDMYLLHGLNKIAWPKIKELGAIEFLEDAKKKGKVRYGGFSFHDGVETFKTIIDAHAWDLCQIQLNYMDVEFQAGLEGLYYAHERGVPVVVMEPLRGGQLVKNVPPEVAAVWNRAPAKRTPAAWALRWVCNHPEVNVVLSGMNTIDEVDENLLTLRDALPNTLSDHELALIDKVKQIYKRKMLVNCTGCGYCIPCPANVSIPTIFSIYNESSMFNNKERASRFYGHLAKNERSADKCIDCGECEEKCPQELAVRTHLQKAHKALHK